jgi:hypothetical protein
MADTTAESASVQAAVAALDKLDAEAEAGAKAGNASATEGSDPSPEEHAAAEAAAAEAERVAAEKAAEEARVAEEQGKEKENEQTQDETPEAKAAREAAEAEARKATERHTVKIDGKDEQLTLDELKALASKGGDYTKKTQQVAEARKQVEAELQSSRAARAEYAAGLEKIRAAVEAIMPPEPDWAKVRAEQPDQYPTLYADYQQRQKQMQALAAEQDRVARAEAEYRIGQHAARVAEETEKFANAVPEFRDPVKGKALRDGLYATAERYGFTRQHVDGTVSAGLLQMLNDARQFHELKAARSAAEAKAKADAAARAAAVKHPVVAPGGSRKPDNSQAKKATDAVNRAAQSGRVDDAAAALDALDL